MRDLFLPVKSRRTAIKRMPWASWIVKVDGGYWGFESYEDYLVYVEFESNAKHFVNKGLKI